MEIANPQDGLSKFGKFGGSSGDKFGGLSGDTAQGGPEVLADSAEAPTDGTGVSADGKSISSLPSTWNGLMEIDNTVNPQN